MCVCVCVYIYIYMYVVQVVIKTAKSLNVQWQFWCYINWPTNRIQVSIGQDFFYGVHFIDPDYFSCYSGTPLTQLANVCCKHYWRLVINIIHASTFCVVKWKWIRQVCISRPCISTASRNVQSGPKKCIHSLLITIFGINLNEISISGWECNIIFSQQMAQALL